MKDWLRFSINGSVFVYVIIIVFLEIFLLNRLASFVENFINIESSVSVLSDVVKVVGLIILVYGLFFTAFRAARFMFQRAEGMMQNIFLWASKLLATFYIWMILLSHIVFPFMDSLLNLGMRSPDYIPTKKEVLTEKFILYTVETIVAIISYIISITIFAVFQRYVPRKVNTALLVLLWFPACMYLLYSMLQIIAEWLL